MPSALASPSSRRWAPTTSSSSRRTPPRADSPPRGRCWWSASLSGAAASWGTWRTWW
uniref:Uncharacterized protein n=1 Tax=Arundo donax TaxID=35708 RepID=A0A0A8YSQ5_ARUDO